MWGLYIYLIFDGYIGMETTNLLPFPTIKTELATLNQFIITILVIRGLLRRDKKLYLTKYSKYLFRFTVLFFLWGFMTWFWVDFSQLEILVFQLIRLLKMVFFVIGVYLTVQTTGQLKTLLILGLGIFFIQDAFQLTEFIVNGRAAIQGGGLSLLAVSIIMLQKNIKPSQKVFFILCIFLIFTSFLLAGTRRGLGALVLVMLVTIFMHSSRKTFFYSAFIMLVFWLTVSILGDVKLLSRIEQSKRLVSFEDSYAWSGRNYLWQSGWEMIKERPVIGHGFGINKEIMSDYLGKTGTVNVHNLKRSKIRMHNTYLKAWAELGLLGLLFFSGMLYFSIRSYYVVANWYKQQGNWIMYILLFGSFANVLGYSAIAFFGWSGYLDKYFWLQTGLALAASKVMLKSQLCQQMTHT